MILLYLKTAFRHIIRHRQNALIIIFSLMVSFAFSNLLLSFILHEINTDSFHHKKDRIYRVLSDDPFGEEGRIRFILPQTTEFFQHQYPEVEAICNVAPVNRNGVVLLEDNRMFRDQMVLGVGDSFFEFFDYPILEGNPAKALTPGGIVLSRKTAEKVFGEPPYVNRALELRQDTVSHLLTVTAVVANQAEHTQLLFDGLIVSDQLEHKSAGASYVLLESGADVQSLIDKINNDENVPSLIGPGKSNYHLDLFEAGYFNGENTRIFERSRNKLFIWICWIVIFLISFAAGFNFVNLFTIGLTGRFKELGMRKILGASRREVSFSIGIEVGLYVILSFLLSLAVTIELLPLFNTVMVANLTLSYIFNFEVIGLILGVIVLIGVLLAVYLSYYVRKLDLIRLFQDEPGRMMRMNRGLFTAQFVVAIGLIICSTVVIRQMQFIQHKQLGFNRHLMEVSAPNEDLKQRMSVLKDKLLQYSKLSSNVALASGNPISGNWQARYELSDGTVFSPYLIWGDENLPEILHLQVIDGVSYQKGENSGRLVNEKLVRLLNIEDPVGKVIPGTDQKIAGIVRDFNNVSLKKEISPYIISYREHLASLLIDISETNFSHIFPLIKESWEEVYPGYVFDYKLINEELLAKHEEDIRFFRILIGFTLASILISCFGLYGIASFTTLQRTKEIGIRKVLGASITSILGMLSLGYFKWIGLGFCIAAPIAWYVMHQWLADFAYHIEIGPGIFAIAGGVAVLIVLVTVSWQSMKAALDNPIESLRS